MAGTYALFRMVYPEAGQLDLTVAYRSDTGRGTLMSVDAPEVTTREIEVQRRSMTTPSGYTDMSEGHHQAIGAFKWKIDNSNFDQYVRLRTRWHSAEHYFNLYPYPDDSDLSGTYYRCYFASPFVAINRAPKNWNLDGKFIVMNECYGTGHVL